jgi:Shikimate kinase
MRLEKHIFMIGFMGVGKTSTSRRLSQKLHVRDVDTDFMIVQREGRSIPEIFEQSGEAYFRQVETEMLDVLAEQEPCVVSCGGGMVMREENVAKMREIGKVVFLTATPETIYERVKDSTHRPLLNGNMNVPYIKELMEAREPKYRAAADVMVATDNQNPGQVAEQIIRAVE